MATSRELRERLQRALEDEWVDGDPRCRCVTCVASQLLSALDAEDRERQQHAERIVSLAALHSVSSGECCDEPEEAGP